MSFFCCKCLNVSLRLSSEGKEIDYNDQNIFTTEESNKLQSLGINKLLLGYSVGGVQIVSC